MEVQLDLFRDNPRVIRKNDAAILLRDADVAGALKIYDTLLEEQPDDEELADRRQAVAPWLEALATFRAAPAGRERLYELWSGLTRSTPPPLASGLRRLLVAELERLPAPERIYIPPRFHIGAILLEEGRYAEAERWLAPALETGIADRARFLAWRGRALAALGSWEAGRHCYRDAFLLDPRCAAGELPWPPELEELIASLEGECGDELDGAPLEAWLPAWGWLQGCFALPAPERPPEQAAAFWDEKETSGSIPPPRLWFEYLRIAEHLRRDSPDHAALVAIRRKMKQLNDPMFRRYLAKIVQAP
ncbi:MAG: hypothetical protein JXB25_01915 [Deltaproteobacteria bacterium]|nr:hypothetical protein [Deltaproteobacteria bacterium]